MNRKMILYILGYVMKIEAALMLLPCLTAIIYKEKEGIAFVITALICLILGCLMTAKKPQSSVFYLKEGCIITSFSWILMSIFGALPFVINGDIPSFTDALFETISGFTTTGASILNDVEALAYCSLMWRSFTHWVGGMGVLVFLLALIPLAGGSHMNIMKAESPGPSVGKLVPKVHQTARLLYIIYIGLTLLQMILLLLGKMPVFDAVTTAFGTAGTGGFGIKNDSLMSYSPYIQWITTIFMILFGVNFNAYYLVLYKKFKKAISMEEVKSYFIIILVAIAIIFINIVKTSAGVFDALRHAAFQVASIITTTGFSTADFDLWSSSAKVVLVLLMFIGACAGSTGGGIKVSRLVILIKTTFRELNAYLHPKRVQKIKMDGKPVDHEVMRSVNVYFITFFVVFAASVFLVSIEGKDLITNFTAVAATINNIGPGLASVGPTQNFSAFTPFSKYILMFDMLAGRLELFPLLVLFLPTIWRDLLIPKNKKKKTETFHK